MCDVGAGKNTTKDAIEEEIMKFKEAVEAGVRCSDPPGPTPDVLAGAEDKRVDPLYDGKIGYIPFAYHLVPQRGLAKIAAVMRCGERIGREAEWGDIPALEQINHALSHIIAYLGGKRGNSHLAHAGCRILMALELDDLDPIPVPKYGAEVRVRAKVEVGTGIGVRDGVRAKDSFPYGLEPEPDLLTPNSNPLWVEEAASVLPSKFNVLGDG